jgi:hypothetical protein
VVKNLFFAILVVLLMSPALPADDALPDLSRVLAKQGFSAVTIWRNYGGQFEVLVQLDGRDNIRLLVDTGCDVTSLDASLMQKLKYRLQQGNEARTLGGSIEQKTTIVQHLQIGDCSVGPLIVSCITLEHINKHRRDHGIATIDGILGMDLMSKHRAIIDVEKSVLYLKKE